MTSPAEHANTVREALKSMRAAAWGREPATIALAALDALQAQAEETARAWDYEKMMNRAEAAEAERDRLKAALQDDAAQGEAETTRVRWLLADESHHRQIAEAERDRLKHEIALYEIEDSRRDTEHDRLAARVKELEAAH